MAVKTLIGALLVTGLFGGILFSAAGRLDWVEGWILTGIYAAGLLGMAGWGAVRAPDLMQERSRMAPNVQGWDKVISRLYGLGFLGLLVIAGLDAGRFGWSVMPLSLKWIGGLGCLSAGYAIWLSMRENAYLSRWARIQADRGQQVISSGPYSVIRHPMYAAILLFVLSSPLLLGSAWALLPAGLVVTLYLLRTHLEDRMLYEELEGYRDYASRVRYRLIPGLW